MGIIQFLGFIPFAGAYVLISSSSIVDVANIFIVPLPVLASVIASTYARYYYGSVNGL
jgi:hypothetical protein